MDDLSRSEYPAMLANLQPGQAVQALNDRIKRINRVNQEVADWLQERRKVEELYIVALRKLVLYKVPNLQSELGVFQPPWDKMLRSTDSIATSHQIFAQRIEKDVELALRGFQNKSEMANLTTISANLHAMARELEEAQHASEKLSKKGKTNIQKADAASSRLESATQQWESQAPFIFESLQAVDEQRVNHLRDLLTQVQTHEVDQAARTQASAEEVLNTMLEISTPQEIQNFAQKTTAGKPKIERRPTGTRQSSIVAGSALAPPRTSAGPEDDISDHSGTKETQTGTESRLRSRIGTMLGRRRLSTHGMSQISPQKLGPYSRNLGSSHSGISPRPSFQNLGDTANNRLESLAESPSSPKTADGKDKSHDGTTNGVAASDGPKDSRTNAQSTSILNGTAEDIFDAPPPPGPPPSHQAQPTKDAEGFTVPSTSDDPISQAQREAAASGGGEDADQFFKLNIKSEPVADEDPDAKQAALSNVANTLTQMGMPSRKAGTTRGRRDVRNTMYMPTSLTREDSSSAIAEAGGQAPLVPPPTVAALVSETSAGSDTQSVRSGVSLGSLVTQQHRHAEALGPGLNASIIEYVSATYEDGKVKAAKINGEIAFSFNPDASGITPERETIRINNFPALSAIGPNRIIASNPSASSPDEFALDVSHLSGRPSPAFTYRMHSDDDASTLAPHCPLALRVAWKPSGDKLGLLLQYGGNHAFAGGAAGALTNVVIIATYTGARASGAQSKPASTHLKDKHVVYWRLGDVALDGAEARIVCRVIGEGGGEPKPGHVEARWEWSCPAGLASAVGSGISISRLLGGGKGKEKATDLAEEDDPFADDQGPLTPALPDGRSWADVATSRKLVSGKYEAK